MANESSGIGELSAAQAALEVAAREQITQLSLALRDEKTPQTARDRIKDQLYDLIPLYQQIIGDRIVIMAARTADDLKVILAVSDDVKKFTYNIKRVEKVLKVTAAFIAFVVACMGAGKNPIPIIQAGKALYDELNKTIEVEKAKGNKAAVVMTALAMPSLLAALGAKAKTAKKVQKKATTKPAAAKARK